MLKGNLTKHRLCAWGIRKTDASEADEAVCWAPAAAGRPPRGLGRFTQLQEAEKGR